MDGSIARKGLGQFSEFRTGLVTNLATGADESSTIADASLKY
jgi:hypothetical protein